LPLTSPKVTPLPEIATLPKGKGKKYSPLAHFG